MYKVLRKAQRIMLKGFTLIWYKFIFKKIGNNSIIRRPSYYINPQCIEIGDYVEFGPYCRVEAHFDYAGKNTTAFLKIGNRVNIQHAVHIYCCESLVIEDNVLIASGCLLTDNNHGMNPKADSYVSQPLISKPTVIKEGVWLGENVCVLAGSVVGERAIIGSNSVVSGVIPPYSIAVGNPARVIKRYNFKKMEWGKVNE